MSRWLQTIRLGLKSLLLHKLRSALAVLGILIGVTAVIWLVAMGEGVSRQAQERIQQLGARNIIIRSIKTAEAASGGGPTTVVYGLTRDDFERISDPRLVPNVKQAVPLRELRRQVIDRKSDTKNELADIRLVGCTPEYLAMNHLQLVRGRFLTDRDLDRRDNVCVIAARVAERSFMYQDPIGKSIQIDKDFYTIVGETAERDPSGAIGGSFAGQDYNEDVYIPLTTLRARIGDQVISRRSGSFESESVELSQITLTVDDISNVDSTAEIVRFLLEKHHKKPDFGIVVPKELLREAELTRITFNVLLIFIAGISLLVGGIGIMNIMLATVTERTREIGIRRALGAKRRDIIEQFLSETVVLSGTGGLLGIGFGFAVTPATWLTQRVLERFFPDVLTALPVVEQLRPQIAPWSIIVAFLISVGVGVLFGLYPARRAAFMDPIEALRHE